MINELLNDHEAVVVQLRKDISTSEEDNAILNSRFLTAMLLEHESTAWILRRYLS
jgi:starvation-inducible DNA-binding protein